MGLTGGGLGTELLSRTIEAFLLELLLSRVVSTLMSFHSRLQCMKYDILGLSALKFENLRLKL